MFTEGSQLLICYISTGINLFNDNFSLFFRCNVISLDMYYYFVFVRFALLGRQYTRWNSGRYQERQYSGCKR